MNDSDVFSLEERERLYKQLEQVKQKNDALAVEVQQQKQDMELKFISQEHRFSYSIWYLFRSFSKDYAHTKSAAIFAFVQRFFPGRTASILAGGSIIGVLTLLLMYRSNELVAKQNYYLQQQIYIQALSDRQRQLIEIKERLYEATPESIAVREQWRAKYAVVSTIDEQHRPAQPLLIPRYNEQVRSEAVKAYLTIMRNPLAFAVKEPAEDIFMPVKKFFQAEKYLPADLPQAPAVGNFISLQFALLSNVTLRGEDLRNVDFSFANLNKADLNAANLSGSDFTGSYLTDVTAVDANFDGAILQGSYLKSSAFHNASFVNAGLRIADLRGAYLRKANFTGADMSWSNFEGAGLSEVNFTDSLLYGANLTGTDLDGAVFDNANIELAIIDTFNFNGESPTIKTFSSYGIKFKDPSLLLNAKSDALAQYLHASCKQITASKQWQQATIAIDCKRVLDGHIDKLAIQLTHPKAGPISLMEIDIQ